MKQKFTFDTQYNQFYLEDKEDKNQIDAYRFWDEKAISDGLALEKGIIGIQTKSYGQIKGEIEVLETAEKTIDSTAADHIVEAGITISSGELQIFDCPNRNVELSIKLPPGDYKVRVYGSNFGSVIESDVSNDSDDDYYRIKIWKDSDPKRKVLKQYAW